MRRLNTLLILAALLLAGCDTVSEMVKGKDNTDPPAPLVEFSAEKSVNTLWSANAGKGIGEQFVNLAPFLNERAIYTAARDGVVTALDAGSGQRLWSAETNARLAGGPGSGDGLVVVGSSDGEVIALSAANGEEKWRARVTSEVLSVPKAAAGIVVARTTDGRLFGLSAEDGKRIWVYGESVPVLTLRGSSSPTLIGGLVICGFDNGKLAILSLNDGRALWEKTIAYPSGRSELDRMVDIDGDPLVVNGVVYVASYQGRVIALDLEKGAILWEKELSSFAGMSADHERLYVTDDNGYVWALDRNSGASLWKQDQLYNRRVTAPASIGDYVVIGDFEGYLHWLSRIDGHFVARTRTDSAGIIAAPIASDNVLYSFGRSGDLTAQTIQ